jgi:uncharacterized NAD(P)/FAD-binding protein YdhS
MNIFKIFATVFVLSFFDSNAALDSNIAENTKKAIITFIADHEPNALHKPNHEASIAQLEKIVKGKLKTHIRQIMRENAELGQNFCDTVEKFAKNLANSRNYTPEQIDKIWSILDIMVLQNYAYIEGAIKYNYLPSFYKLEDIYVIFCTIREEKD